MPVRPVGLIPAAAADGSLLRPDRSCFRAAVIFVGCRSLSCLPSTSTPAYLNRIVVANGLLVLITLHHLLALGVDVEARGLVEFGRAVPQLLDSAFKDADFLVLFSEQLLQALDVVASQLQQLAEILPAESQRPVFISLEQLLYIRLLEKRLSLQLFLKCTIVALQIALSARVVLNFLPARTSFLLVAFDDQLLLV